MPAAISSSPRELKPVATCEASFPSSCCSTRCWTGSRLPVIGAGGIGTARALAATLAAGAAGARVGTRFIASVESGAHTTYIEALLRADSTDTVLTTAFSVGWPNVPHRVLRSCVAEAASLQNDPVGEEHLEGSVVPVLRFSTPPPGRAFTGAIEAMALYAGQGVGAIRRIQPAEAIVAELVEGAEQLLRFWG